MAQAVSDGASPFVRLRDAIFKCNRPPLPKWRVRLAKATDGVAIKVVFNLALIFALFGGGIWEVCNVNDNPGNQALDALQMAVLVLFILEISLSCLTDLNYPLSFFFFMDILGTASQMFEISFFLGPAGKVNTTNSGVDPTLLRTARVAKMAARAGRFLKLAKFLELIILGGRRPEAKAGPQGGVRDSQTAHKISQKLSMSISSKVSLLTILLVILIPVFSIGEYPEADLSMQAWAQRLELSYKNSYAALASNASASSVDAFHLDVLEMLDFYTKTNYFPYLLTGYDEEVTFGSRKASIPGASLVNHAATPIRKQNILILSVNFCQLERPGCSASDGSKASVSFDFTAPNQVTAGLQMGICVFVIFVMSAVTLDMNLTVDYLVVKPMERMLGVVRELALTILSLPDVAEAQNSDELEGVDNRRPDETDMLERALEKLALLAKLLLAENRVSRASLAEMNHEEKGVMIEVIGCEVVEDGAVAFRAKPRLNTAGSANGGPPVDGVHAADHDWQGHLRAAVDTWSLDFLTLNESDREWVVMSLFFDSELSAGTGEAWTDPITMDAFYKAIMAGYNDMPYHNAMHACDILHTVYRTLCVTKCQEWASEVQQFALMVASLAHDLGHKGRTNPFLVEIRDDLALQYNDASPLENLHCANLFRIAAKPNTAIFRELSAADYKTARKVCIATILHTDNAHHFDMVKEMQRVYEVYADLCESQAACLRTEGGDLDDASYKSEVLCKESLKFLQLFLHLADVSNPLKPFAICQAWAWRVLEEFFDQGDEEKKLGLPVGMLNDRERVNKPASQHGFITVLVAPLVFASVKLFPSLHVFATQMASNLKDWRDIWVETSSPEPEAVVKRDEDVQKIAAVAEELRIRVAAPSADADRASSFGSTPPTTAWLQAPQPRPTPGQRLQTTEEGRSPSGTRLPSMERIPESEPLPSQPKQDWGAHVNQHTSV